MKVDKMIRLIGRTAEGLRHIERASSLGFIELLHGLLIVEIKGHEGGEVVGLGAAMAAA